MRADLNELDMTLLEKFHYDDVSRSDVYAKGEVCVILDHDICNTPSAVCFDYSKYCEMQNRYMFRFTELYRFNCVDGEIPYAEIWKYLDHALTDSAEDSGGIFDQTHVDNTPLEKSFEDLFIETYGHDALQYLHKEYAVSLDGGRTAFADYVIETENGTVAIEENGVSYHHPQLIGRERYEKQLQKQNHFSSYGFKTYRFSTQNLAFHEQIIDSIRKYLGGKETFLHAHLIKGDREFRLYEHQENALERMKEDRASGIGTSLIVCPTGTGKSRIVLEDLKALAEEHLVRNVLIMVPSNAVRNDWKKRIEGLNPELRISVETYNAVFTKRNTLGQNAFDYICFDEAQHAQAANCKKTLQFFTPKYLVGLTATPDRLDRKKLEEIFGQYETQMTLQEAVEQDIICNIRCYRLISNLDLSQIRYNGQDYNYADLEKNVVIESRNELIVDTLKKYFFPRKDFYKQGIVFCVNVSHARKLEKMMCQAGFMAAAVYGGNKKNEQILEDYRNRKIQFLLNCMLISEGWDSPQTEVVVMARPTLSKVLYLQQLGRGVRKYPGKECLYVIDVVDNYESRLTPWNFHALFRIDQYSPFMGLKNNQMDYLSILGLSETELAMEPVDILTFEEKYAGYRSPEQAARELFVGTSTLMNWYRRQPSIASLTLPIGSRIVPYFSESDVESIRESRQLGVHTDETIAKDFEDFIDENTLTFSFKLVFMLSMLKLANSEGEVNIDELTHEYKAFYLDRIDRGLPVDRSNCIYTKEYLNDTVALKRSILSNPFEKFERKRFVYYSKDLNMLAFNPALWTHMDRRNWERIKEKETAFLQEYYADKGGL